MFQTYHSVIFKRKMFKKSYKNWQKAKFGVKILVDAQFFNGST